MSEGLSANRNVEHKTRTPRWVYGWMIGAAIFYALLWAMFFNPVGYRILYLLAWLWGLWLFFALFLLIVEIFERIDFKTPIGFGNSSMLSLTILFACVQVPLVSYQAEDWEQKTQARGVAVYQASQEFLAEKGRCPTSVSELRKEGYEVNDAPPYSFGFKFRPLIARDQTCDVWYQKGMFENCFYQSTFEPPHNLEWVCFD